MPTTLRWIPFLLLLLATSSRADPVTDFIVEADARAQESEAALADFVAAHPLLVGAAVAQLLDVGFEVGMAGQTGDEADNVAFAERVARLHAPVSPVPLELVTTYQDWDDTARARRSAAQAKEAEATEARDAGDHDRAIALLEEARTLYEDLGDRHSLAVLWGSIGVVRWYQGDFDAVRTSYGRALELRREVEDRILEGRTLNGLGSVNWRTEHFDEALTWYRQAADLRERTGDQVGLGTSLTYLGNVYLARNQLLEARHQYERAIPILEASGNAPAQLEMWNNVGALHSEMGRFGEAARAYDRAIALARELEDPANEAIAHLNLAQNLRIQGRLGEAQDHLAQVDGVIPEADDPAFGSMFQRERALVFLELGDHDRSADALRRSIALAKESQSPQLEMDALVNLGHLYFDLGHYPRAMQTAETVIQQAIDNADGRKYRFGQVLAGWVTERMGDVEASLAHWEEARAQDEVDGTPTQLVVDDVGIANALALLGRHEEARTRFRRAAAQSREVYPLYEWTAWLGLGHTFETTDPDSAAHFYDRALGLLETQRRTGGDAAVTTGFQSGNRSLAFQEVTRYYAGLALDGDPRWSERAFNVVERSRARGLLDMLDRSTETGDWPEMTALLDRLYQANQDRAARGERLRLEEEIARLRAERVDARFGQAAATSVPSLEEVRKALPRKTALLSYALGDSASWLWVVDRKGHDLVRLSPRPTLQAQVDRLRAALAARGSNDAVLRETARSLHRELLEPVADRLRNAETLVLVGDGPLLELPFDLLLTEDFDGEWSDAPVLARDLATTTAPSAAVYLTVAGRKAAGFSSDLLAVGDPDYSASPDLRPLPDSRAEVEAIAADVRRSTVLLGADATESRLLEELRRTSPRVVHLAAHGLVDAAEPNRSAIALASSDTDDGRLHTLEVLSSPFDVGLAVLSACESARGRVQQGEGVLGLTRAFFAAGANGIVASLWPVSDEATAALMREFYSRMLGRKRSATRALREARLALLDSETYSHPYYWAAFVVAGSDRAPW